MNLQDAAAIVRMHVDQSQSLHIESVSAIEHKGSVFPSAIFDVRMDDGSIFQVKITQVK